jgi:hypothetical protein
MVLGLTLGNMDVWAFAPAWGPREKLIDSLELVSKPASFGTRTFLCLASFQSVDLCINYPTAESPGCH